MDVFGVRWPRYKVEAVLAGVIALLVTLLVAGAVGLPALSPAVLAGAGAGTLMWWLGRAVASRS